MVERYDRGTYLTFVLKLNGCTTTAWISIQHKRDKDRQKERERERTGKFRIVLLLVIALDGEEALIVFLAVHICGT
jgi:hypothetical protein